MNKFLGCFVLWLGLSACNSPELVKLANPVVDLGSMGPKVNMGTTYVVNYQVKLPASKTVSQVEVLIKYPGDQEFSRYALLSGNPGKFKWLAPTQVIDGLVIGVRAQDQRANWGEISYSPALQVLQLFRFTETRMAQAQGARTDTALMGGECFVGADVQVSTSMVSFADPAADTQPQVIPNSGKVLNAPCTETNGQGYWSIDIPLQTLSPDQPYGQASFVAVQDHNIQSSEQISPIGRTLTQQPSFPSDAAALRSKLAQKIKELSWHEALAQVNYRNMFDAQQGETINQQGVESTIYPYALPGYASTVQSSAISTQQRFQNSIAVVLGFRDYEDLLDPSGSVPYQVIPVQAVPQGYALSYVQFPKWTESQAVCSASEDPQVRSFCESLLKKYTSKATFPLGVDGQWRLGIFNENGNGVGYLDTWVDRVAFNLAIQRGVNFIQDVSQAFSSDPASFSRVDFTPYALGDEHSRVSLVLSHYLSADMSDLAKSLVRKSKIDVQVFAEGINLAPIANAVIQDGQEPFDRWVMTSASKVSLETIRDQLSAAEGETSGNPMRLGETTLSFQMAQAEISSAIGDFFLGLNTGDLQGRIRFVEGAQAFDFDIRNGAQNVVISLDRQEAIRLPVLKLKGLLASKLTFQEMQFEANTRAITFDRDLRLGQGSFTGFFESGTSLQMINVFTLNNTDAALAGFKVLTGKVNLTATQSYAPRAGQAVSMPVLPSVCVGFDFNSFANRGGQVQYPYLNAQVTLPQIDQAVQAWKAQQQGTVVSDQDAANYRNLLIQQYAPCLSNNNG